MKTHFYDIESLNNAFTLANWKPEENHVDLYYLLDDGYMDQAMKDASFQQKLLDHVHKVNKNFTGTMSYHDLHGFPANDKLFSEFGLSDAFKVNNRSDKSTYPVKYRPVCDTDPDYDEDKQPFLMGYNSDNYDLTMMAVYANEAFALPRQASVAANGQAAIPANPIKQLCQPAEMPSAKLMRAHNNLIFRSFKKNMPEYLKMDVNPITGAMSDQGWSTERRRIWKNFKLSGRHVDVSKLNEKQQKVALKRMIGQLGGQILESDKLDESHDTLENLEELMDLIAYNISDVVNLDLIVFRNKLYQSKFNIKRNMLKSYPELIYEKKATEYAPDINPDRVRKDRLFADSSSAQLATKSLCPYGHLRDIPAVSFMYPHPDKAKEMGIQPKNILEETKTFFYRNFSDPGLRAEFDRIYNYYKDIEGRNFNESDNYRADYAGTPQFVPYSDINSIPKNNTSLMYYKKDGTPTRCFVNFSIGGIHGAECNLELWQYHHYKWQKQMDLLNRVRAMYPDPVELRRTGAIEIDGIRYTWSNFLKTGANLTHAVYKDLESKEPLLFVEKSGKTELNSKYTYTSADTSEHEDFTSYYPNLLRMMKAFYNPGLGYDRYAEIFDQKQYYGFLMKPKNANLSPEDAKFYEHLRVNNGFEVNPLVVSDKERAYYGEMRENTKLILNSASGAADANFESPIRMNNTIISMRIIGQLFTYTIGQAQAIEGARIISTNTDGLYSVMELPGKPYEECRDFNNMILERESKNIGVEIEPETLYLISKDTNNRLEADPSKQEIEKANGGSLACFRGPNPEKSLAHSALQDWAMTEYLYYMATDPMKKGYSIKQPFNETVGMNILKSASTAFKGWKLLNMFQTMLASSVSSITYVFGTKPGQAASAEPVILRHYNRVFLVKPGTRADALNLHAACGRVITQTTKDKRKRNNESYRQNDPLAVMVIKKNGVDDVMDELGPDREAKIVKINGISEKQECIVVNDDLTLYTQEQIDAIMECIDYGAYLGLLCDSFSENWKNTLWTDEKAKDDEAERIAEEVRQEKKRKADEKLAAAAEKQRIAAEKKAEKERLAAEKKAKKEQEKLEREKTKAAKPRKKAADPLPEERPSGIPSDNFINPPVDNEPVIDAKELESEIQEPIATDLANAAKPVIAQETADIAPKTTEMKPIGTVKDEADEKKFVKKEPAEDQEPDSEGNPMAAMIAKTAASSVNVGFTTLMADIDALLQLEPSDTKKTDLLEVKSKVLEAFTNFTTVM